jgi:hypothetical protein
MGDFVLFCFYTLQGGKLSLRIRAKADTQA